MFKNMGLELGLLLKQQSLVISRVKLVGEALGVGGIGQGLEGTRGGWGWSSEAPWPRLPWGAGAPFGLVLARPPFQRLCPSFASDLF